jgi:hypothetical protein
VRTPPGCWQERKALEKRDAQLQKDIKANAVKGQMVSTSSSAPAWTKAPALLQAAARNIAKDVVRNRSQVLLILATSQQRGNTHFHCTHCTDLHSLRGLVWVVVTMVMW